MNTLLIAGILLVSPGIIFVSWMLVSFIYHDISHGNLDSLVGLLLFLGMIGGVLIIKAL